MDDFTFYLNLGWHHIISLDALDHLMFLTALAAIYLIGNWKQVLILITAFTVGHTLTLALSTYNVIRFNTKWVEFLIPLTIVITAFLNLFQNKITLKTLRLNYFIALFFGLIHGMGFANTIRFMLAKDQHIAIPLLGFNIGIEAGQILVVLLILIMSFLVVNRGRLPRRWWVNVLSITTLLIASVMCIRRWPI